MRIKFLYSLNQYELLTASFISVSLGAASPKLHDNVARRCRTRYGKWSRADWSIEDKTMSFVYKHGRAEFINLSFERIAGWAAVDVKRRNESGQSLAAAVRRPPPPVDLSRSGGPRLEDGVGDRTNIFSFNIGKIEFGLWLVRSVKNKRLESKNAPMRFYFSMNTPSDSILSIWPLFHYIIKNE